MKYEWVTLGNQEEHLRENCLLGPHRLIISESSWIKRITTVGEICLYSASVWTWNASEGTWETTWVAKAYIPKEEAKRTLEDWYGANVLLESLIAGEKDE